MFGASSGLFFFVFFFVPVNVLWSQSHQTCTGTKKTKKKQTTRCTKPAQAPKKTKKNKPLDAPNLHRHQKKQKKLKFPGTMGPLLSSCWNFCFFFVFFWCLSMFGASSGLVFLFFLVPVNVLWSQSHQTCTGTKKKQKKQTTRCTKSAQAPKKTKKN